MRLLIVDDHDLIREALQARLEAIPGCEVVGSASNGAEALAMLAKARPEVAILDFQMPLMNGAECARRIKDALPDCHVLFLTGFPDDEALLDSVGLASGYVTKSATWSMLEQALDAIAHGKAFVDPHLVPAIMHRAAAADHHQLAMKGIDPQRLLTPTEGRVALLAAEGLSNQGIAGRLSMSENTVKAHLQRAFRKLGVHSRQELAARARS